jgi:signal transduction histidine kinase
MPRKCARRPLRDRGLARSSGRLAVLAARGADRSSGCARRATRVRQPDTRAPATRRGGGGADRGRSMEGLIAMLSHELRKPLAAIPNAVHLMRSRELAEAEFQC